MAARIAIVDDHGLVAHTLAAALESAGAEATIVDPLREPLHQSLEAIEPELVLLDLDLGGAGEASQHISRIADSGANVVVVTGVTDPVRHARCVREGAVGVVDKGDSFDRLVEAVEQVLAEGTLLTAHDREEHLALLREHESRRDREHAPFEALTDREAEVLGALMRGRSVQEVADADVVAVSTVRSQVRAILTKLGVGSQLAAIGRAREVGWVPPQERG